MGGHEAQAAAIAETVLPALLARGHPPEQIAILYRAAWLDDKVSQALDGKGVAHVRTDGNALIKRSSRLARFVEGCAGWVTGGWREADPPYGRLLAQALALVHGGRASDAEQETVSRQLITFLRNSIDAGETTHGWLQRLCRELVAPWRTMARNLQQEWEICSEMVVKTDPARDKDMLLNVFSGRASLTLGRGTLPAQPAGVTSP